MTYRAGNSNKNGKMPHNNNSVSSRGATRIVLPRQIKCLSCQVPKNPAAFSDNQRHRLQEKIYRAGASFDAVKEPLVSCSSCTDRQQFEFFCNGCDKSKSRSSFSKAQLKDPDNAKCIPCMEDQQNMGPGGADSDGDDDNGSDDDSSSEDDSNGGGTSTMTGTFSALSVTNGSSGTGGVSLPKSPSAGYSSGGFTVAATRSPFISTQKANFSNFAKAPKMNYMFASDAAKRVREADAKDNLNSTCASDSDSESG